MPRGMSGGNREEYPLVQNFSALRYVTVVSNSGREEIMYLENLENQEEE